MTKIEFLTQQDLCKYVKYLSTYHKKQRVTLWMSTCANYVLSLILINKKQIKQIGGERGRAVKALGYESQDREFEPT